MIKPLATFAISLKLCPNRTAAWCLLRHHEKLCINGPELRCVQKLSTTTRQCSIFPLLKSGKMVTDLPDLGKPMESWYYDVQRDGKLTVRSLLDVHIQPLDPQKHPDMNKMFINIIYMGKDDTSNSPAFDLSKQYIVNVDLDDNNQDIELTVKQKSEQKIDALCHIQVPMNYDVNVTCFKNGEASLAMLEGKNIIVRTQNGDCHFRNIKAFNVDVRTQRGGIVCQKLLQGNLKLVTEGSRGITAGRLQGQMLDLQCNTGDVNVKALYSMNTRLASRQGNVVLGTCHGETDVTIGTGNLNIESVDGKLVGEVTNGDSEISMSGQGSMQLNTKQGDIKVSIPETINSSVHLQGSQIDTGDVIIDNLQSKNSDNTQTITGELFDKSSRSSSKPDPTSNTDGLVAVSTQEGNITLSYYNWFASLNLNKD